MQQIEVRDDLGLGMAVARTPSLGNHFAKTANYSIASGNGDAGKTFSNKGAGGAVVFTLPAPLSGVFYNFAKLAAQNLTIQASGGAKINNSAANGTYANTTNGDSTIASVEVWSPDGVSWLVRGPVGTWATT